MTIGSFRGTGAYVVPPPLTGKPPGVPASLMAKVRGILQFENFLGAETASRSAQQWVEQESGPGALITPNANPDTGDLITLGMCRFAAPSDPAARVGVGRAQSNSMGVDGFSDEAPYLFASRFRVTSAMPSVTDYEISVGGMLRAITITAAPTEGIEIAFDATLGIRAWVLRGWRGSVKLDGAGMAGFDSDWHVAGFLAEFGRATPFFDGVVFPTVAGANMQPNSVCAGRVMRLFTATAGAIDAQADVDWVLHGR